MNIFFKNEPKLSPHEADAKYNERRLNLIPQVRNFITKHPRFNGKEVNINFAQKGVSSLVCIIETSTEKLIFKVHLSIKNALGEGQFLKVWEQAGVKVPHVIEDGMLGEHPYTMMEYIDAPTLDTYTKEEQAKEKIHFKMGQALCLMHKPKTEGYGKVVDGKAEFKEFKDWLLSPDIKKRFDYVKEHSLLGEEHGSLDKALEILLNHVAQEANSSYCHDDFGGNNIFATDPITVFDPSPRFNNSYIDLGRSIFNLLPSHNAIKQFIDGYFADNPYDKKVLHASVLLSCYMKFPYWHKTKKFEKIKSIQEYLIESKDLFN